MNPRPITVLVDTYNHERYIEQALVSVLEQGLSPSELEIVVVDDGSTDNTPSIIQQFAPRVKHLRKQQGGQASAFNAGFAESHGEIIATLDGDDWWAKGKLTAVVEALEKNPEVAAVGHGHYQFYDDTREMRLRVVPERKIVNLGTPGAVRWWAFMLPSALTVRRRVLEWITPIPEKMVFMADSAIQAAATVMGTLVLEEPLFYYRCHAENLYVFDPQNTARLRRRHEMAEIAYGGVYKRLVELGISAVEAFDLIGDVWLEAKRARLHLSGGTRLEALQTEMQAFHASFKNPSIGYRLFKYFVVGAATLVFPPRYFYGIREWYASHHLGRYRDRLLRADATSRGDS